MPRWIRRSFASSRDMRWGIFRRRKHQPVMPTADQMPDDNAGLARVEVAFDRLRSDTAESCPVPLSRLMEYLAREVPDGEHLSPEALAFIRTAAVADRRYWIWSFQEPGDG